MSKREREEYSDGFRRSKRTIRSPEQRLAEQEKESSVIEKQNIEAQEMEEIKGMMKEIMTTLKQDMGDLKEEIKELRREMKDKESKWEREKEELMKRIGDLEERMENEEKRKRKNNIVIKGLQIRGENEISEVESFLKEKLQVCAKVIRTQIINTKRNNEKIIIAEVEAWTKKQEIMRQKSILRNTRVYIDNDLTAEELWVQREIRSIAKEQREKGCRVKVSYRRLKINDEEYVWDKREKGVKLANNPKTSKN